MWRRAGACPSPRQHGKFGLQPTDLKVTAVSSISRPSASAMSLSRSRGDAASLGTTVRWRALMVKGSEARSRDVQFSLKSMLSLVSEKRGESQVRQGNAARAAGLFPATELEKTSWCPWSENTQPEPHARHLRLVCRTSWFEPFQVCAVKGFTAKSSSVLTFVWFAFIFVIKNTIYLMKNTGSKCFLKDSLLVRLWSGLVFVAQNRKLQNVCCNYLRLGAVSNRPDSFDSLTCWQMFSTAECQRFKIVSAHLFALKEKATSSLSDTKQH